MTLYNTNIDLINDKVYTKFGQILSIHSQDIEQKPPISNNNNNNIIIIIIKSLFHEGNTISTELISLAALKYLQIYIDE